ncbi:GNAT family N-acetyltransferase [Chengkuizengella axinellae]
MRKKKKLIYFGLSVSIIFIVFLTISFIYSIYYYTNNRVGPIGSLTVPKWIYFQYFIQMLLWILHLIIFVVMAFAEKKKKQFLSLKENNYLLYKGTPDVNDYLNLRKLAGLSEKSEAGAKLGLKHTIYAISIYANEYLIGMGRLIGDKGCFYQVVDIAVEPNYQGQGLGKLIMNELSKDIDENAPEGAYISLIADEPADKLYEKYGFQYTYPASHGMFKKI